MKGKTGSFVRSSDKSIASIRRDTAGSGMSWQCITGNRSMTSGCSARSWGSSPLVTEFKYYMETEVHKVFLSAILDLCDRRLVAYKIRSHNDNELNMATFYEAVEKESGAHPLMHSDRGVQYTSLSF